MKKNNFKLKDEIIILPNADKKEWHETWTKESHGYDVLVGQTSANQIRLLMFF